MGSSRETAGTKAGGGVTDNYGDVWGYVITDGVTNTNTNNLFSRPEPLLKGCEHIAMTYHAMTLNNAAIHTHTVLIQE